MRTTVRLNDALLQRAKQEAADHDRTLTSLIEQGLELVLAKPAASKPKRRVRLPVSRQTGGTLPGIDINNSVDLFDRMDGLR